MLADSYTENIGNDSERKAKERKRALMTDLVKWLDMEMAMTGQARSSNNSVTAKTIRTIVNREPRNIDGNNASIKEIREDVSNYMKFSPMLQKWIKAGIHNVGIP